jgi:hypothetical protein
VHHLFSLFQIHWNTLTKNKFEFLDQKNQHPNSWDNLPYYEFEEYVKLLNQRNKEINDERKKQDTQQQSNVPNMNSFKPSNFKTPVFKTPNFKR